MFAWKIGIGAVSHLVHRHLLGLIVSSYALAAFCPALGLWIKDARLDWALMGHGEITLSLPPLMLSFLLFSAGLRVRRERRWRHLLACRGRNVRCASGGCQELVERLVNLLAAEPLLHLRVHLECRPRVLVADLPHHVRERCPRLDQQADVRAP